MSVGKKIVDGAQDISDALIDSIEKRDTPASRAGNSVERAAKLAKSGFSKKAIAEQFTGTSPHNHKYDESFVKQLVNFAEDNSTRVMLTAAQTRAGIRDQQKHGQSPDGVPDLEPRPC